MTESLEQRVYAWLPARRSKQRVTSPSVAAANLGVPLGVLLPVWRAMELSGHVWAVRGGFQQGRPLPSVDVPVVEDVPLLSWAQARGHEGIEGEQ